MSQATLHCLFIGIDRYSAPVLRLSCAKADAVALGALFKDSGVADVRYLIDEDATRARIIDALESLKSVPAGDMVVVGFSGHGTEDHELVPVDVDPNNLARSCVSLDDLARHLDDMPARQMIVVLDCCFAGGFGGARVFAPSASRAPLEDRSTLEGLVRGDGRIVLTASGSGEPALETNRFGHGLFTFHLLEALQGVGDHATVDRLPLYAVLDYVTTSVMDSAKLLNDKQTPTIYGSIEGAPTLPRLSPGREYAAAFPNRVRPPATSAWDSLLPYGFGQGVLDRWSTSLPSGLNDLQLSAVNDYGVLDGRSVLVVAPTSSGKTMIGELAAVRAAMNNQRSIMLFPLKALVNDKYEALLRTYKEDLTVVRSTGDMADQNAALYAGQYDIALLTYEKFLSMVIGSPWLLRGVSVVVVDEAQNISDPSRGKDLELLLTLLRSGHARGGAPQIIALSAVIGNTNGLERWLAAGLLHTTERPVPLRESLIDSRGNVQHLLPDGEIQHELGFVHPILSAGLGEGSKPVIIPLVQKLVAEGKKVIVFRAVKGETFGTARYLAQQLGLQSAASALDRLPDGDLSSASRQLRQSLKGGVAFHNADLSTLERVTLEAAFRDPDSDLRVVVATTTLAMGVNTPAEAVVVAGLTHLGPQPMPYSIAEYKNMTGRSGRLGFADEGESYIIATGDPTPGVAWNYYIQGTPESVVSHFLSGSTDPQTLILRCLTALNGSVELIELLSVLENSFAIWRQVDMGGNGWDQGALHRDLQALANAGLVDIEAGDIVTITELGRFAGESGIEVRSVAQVSSLLRFVPGPITGPNLVTIAQATVELDGVYLPNATRSRQEQGHWPATLARFGVSTGMAASLHVGGGVVVVRQKRAAACLLFISATPMASIEAELMQHLPNDSAAGPVRSVAARTRDVLGVVASICRIRGQLLADEVEVDDLLLRLELGLPAHLVELARLVGTQLTRAEYLALDVDGIRSAADIAGAEPDRLERLVGVANADALLEAARL